MYPMPLYTHIMRHMSKSCFLAFFLLCYAAMPLHALNSPSNTASAAIQNAEKDCKKLFLSPRWKENELIFYNQPSWTIIVVITVFACVGYLVAWLLLRNYKKTFLTLDRKGIILENGKRILWKQLERVEEKDIKRSSYSSDLAKAYDVEQSKRKMKETKFDQLNDLENKTAISNPYQEYVLQLTICYPKPREGKQAPTVKLKKGLGGMSSYEAIKELMDLIRAYQEAYHRTEQGGEWSVEYDKSTLKNNFPHLEKEALMLKNMNTRIEKLYIIVQFMISVILCIALYFQLKKPGEKILIIGNAQVTDYRDGKKYTFDDDITSWGRRSSICGFMIDPNNKKNKKTFVLFPEEIIPLSIWNEKVLLAIRKGTFLKDE